MTMTNDYRRPRDEAPSDNAWMSALRAEVEAGVRSEVNALRQQVTALQQQLNGATIDVHIAPPNMEIENKVEQARVYVDSPVTVDMGPMAARFTALEQRIDQLCTLLAQPITRTIKRDNNGRILSLTEKRG
jgi:uncharacterized protein involved in exopolysaccharide biosynthesis